MAAASMPKPGELAKSIKVLLCLIQLAFLAG
jgi:hypothetical protein